MSEPLAIELLPVDSISLDAENPRLPERSKPWSQSEIIAHLNETEVLDELAKSMADDGFFPHEPIIVVPAGKAKQYIAVEGNRRLATVKILLEDEAADDIAFDVSLTKSDKDALRAIPAIVVPNRESVATYIGFRHIGGIKMWSPESKARWTVHYVDAAKSNGAANPFKLVAEEVGTNTTGIRASYLAIRILQHARDEFNLSVTRILNPKEARFGVWLRCMSVPTIRQFIGIADPTTWEEVQSAVKKVKKKDLKEVVEDLAPKSGSEPLLRDSRDVTTYGRILVHEKAHKVLRETKDFDLAKQLIDLDLLPARFKKVVNRCDAIRAELENGADVGDEVSHEISRLINIAKQMMALVEKPQAHD